MHVFIFLAWFFALRIRVVLRIVHSESGFVLYSDDCQSAGCKQGLPQSLYDNGARPRPRYPANCVAQRQREDQVQHELEVKWDFAFSVAVTDNLQGSDEDYGYVKEDVIIDLHLALVVAAERNGHQLTK